MQGESDGEARGGDDADERGGVDADLLQRRNDDEHHQERVDEIVEEFHQCGVGVRTLEHARERPGDDPCRHAPEEQDERRGEDASAERKPLRPQDPDIEPLRKDVHGRLPR